MSMTGTPNSLKFTAFAYSCKAHIVYRSKAHQSCDQSSHIDGASALAFCFSNQELTVKEPSKKQVGHLAMSKCSWQAVFLTDMKLLAHESQNAK